MKPGGLVRSPHLPQTEDGRVMPPKAIPRRQPADQLPDRRSQHWQHKPDPLPFALAEYNAGASRAQRWNANEADDASMRSFLKNIDFPGTRNYVQSIIDRYKFYQRRGRM